MERRLSAIMAADVAGYSASMAADETGTIDRLARLRTLIDSHVSARGGRVFNQAGDGFLAEFPSPVSAVRAAYELQRELVSPDVAGEIGLVLRIGIHLADVVVKGDDLLGDGVNIASRIEHAAEPATVHLSASVFDLAKRSSQLKFERIGEKRFKNIAEPVVVYRVLGELDNHSCITAMPGSSSASARSAKPHSIVVIPFQNMSGDSEQEYFADGFTEDVITELSRFPGIFCISRNASFGLKGLNRDARDIGREMNVHHVLEGGIRKLGNRIRISSHLTETATGNQIWTEKSDCTFDELFDVQDDLVAKIVASVAGHIERAAEASARRKRPADLEAYECLLRGMEFHRLGGVTVDNARQAYDWFQMAIDKDPKFGRAHAWRACALATLAEWTGEDVWGELLDIGRMAVELDETEPECHRIAGSLALYSRDFERAEYHFKRALQLNPHHAYIVGRMGELYNFLGDAEKALEYQERAMQLDPLLPEYCRELEVVAHYVLGDFARCYRVVDEFPRLTRRAAAYRVAAALHLNDPLRLHRAVNALLAHDPDFKPTEFVLTEYFRDRATANGLKGDLKQALDAVRLKAAS